MALLHIWTDDLEGSIRVSLVPFDAKYYKIHEDVNGLVMRALDHGEFGHARDVLKEKYWAREQSLLAQRRKRNKSNK